MTRKPVPREYWWAAGVALLVLGSLLGMMFFRQTSPAEAQAITFIYSAPFACVPDVGPAEIAGVENPFVAFGVPQYRTVINVHNHNAIPIVITKKAVNARSEDIIPRGRISPFKTEQLQPNEALAIDCLDVLSLFGGAMPIGNGMVEVLTTDLEVTVWATYTNNGTGKVGLDVERILPTVVQQ